MICKDSSKWAVSYCCVIPVVSKQQQSIQLLLLDMATERRREALFTVQRHEHCKVSLLSFPQDPNLCFPIFCFFQTPSTNHSSVIMSVRAEQPELEWKQLASSASKDCTATVPVWTPAPSSGDVRPDYCDSSPTPESLVEPLLVTNITMLCTHQFWSMI